MTEFWKAMAVAEPLTTEGLQKMLDQLWTEYQAVRPYECPHKSVVLHPNVARRICGPDGIPCPWGCGKTLVAP